MEEEIKNLQNLLTFKEVEIKSLKQNIENYEKILSLFPGIVVVINREGIIEYINQNGAKILGYLSQEELIGQNWFEKCIPSNIKETLKFIFNKIIEGYLEEFKIYENPVETKFKTQKIFQWRNNYVKDSEGNIIETVSYGIEISKESLNKEKLSGLTKIFDILPEAIHIIDREYTILYFNETFKKWNAILGFPIDVLGKNLFKVFPFLPEKVKEEYENVFNTGGILITEEKNIVKNKEIITETRKVPIFEKERVTHIITFMREITHFLNF